MKCAKWIIGVFLTIVCLVGGSEIYQKYVVTFTNQFFYIDMDVPTQKEESFAKLEELAVKNDVPILAVERNVVSTFRTTLNIYTSHEMKETLEKSYDIHEGVQNSLFSGKTEIIYHDLDVLRENNPLVRFYFDADEDSVKRLRTELNYYFPCSHYHREMFGGYEKLLLLMWGVVYLFILFLTWLDIQFQKKRDFLLVSLGKQMEEIALENVVLDVIVFAGGFIVGWLVLKNRIHIDYHLSFVMMIGVLFLIVNSLLYLSLFHYSYKEILYGANLNEKALNNSYVIKVLTMILTIASLSFNASLIMDNLQDLNSYNETKNYQEYGSLHFEMDYSVFDDEGFERYVNQMNEIVDQLYRQKKVLLSMNLGQSLTGPVLLVNENASLYDRVVKEKVKDTSKDVYIVIPEKTENYVEDVDMALSMIAYFLGIEKSEINYEVIQNKNSVLYFDFREGTKLTTGAGKMKNPIVAYCTLNEKMTDVHTPFGGSSESGNLLFRLDDEDIKRLESLDGIKSVTYQGVVDKCGEYRDSILRTILLNSIISLVLLVFEFSIMITITRLEYMMNAKLLAVKKILGYSVFAKNAVLFELNAFAAGISIVTAIIASKMFGILKIPVVIGVAAFLVLIEMIFIIVHIGILERTQIPKILKGGSL